MTICSEVIALIRFLPSLLAAAVEGTTLAGTNPSGLGFTGPPAPMEAMVRTIIAKKAMARAKAISVIALLESLPVDITFPSRPPGPSGKKNEPPQSGAAPQINGEEQWNLWRHQAKFSKALRRGRHKNDVVSSRNTHPASTFLLGYINYLM